MTPHAILKEMDTLRRLAVGYSLMRGGANGDILDATNHPIGTFTNPADAVYFARLHNLYIELVNLVLDLRRRLTDREAMKREQNEEGKRPLSHPRLG